MSFALSNIKISLIGSGPWGSAIAKVIGNNVMQYQDIFQSEILMYVYEETFNGRSVTDIINEEHENTKYLPDIKLPVNVVASSDVVKVTQDADILVFVLPHQFVEETCQKMKEAVKKSALAVSLIKGFILVDGGGMHLVTQVIGRELEIATAVLMGANLATEVASELFCETTIACDDPTYDHILRSLFETNYFRCKLMRCVEAVESCGALKNVVSIAAGFIDGLGYGDNTKAAVIRLGLMEMIKFNNFYLDDLGLDPPSNNALYLESCGIGDLVATCHGGRNRLLGEAIVKSIKQFKMKTGTDIKALEKEILKGQSFQGPLIAREIYNYLRLNNRLLQFPLLVSVHLICNNEMDPRNFIDSLKNHPEHD